ncbi:hypothetical protein BRADO0810 [Bradyrhizobium sp. ORS 278]|nr:hypothetical protein BRADO0810 [Bradyrhizobium sp. ORS 278]
MAGSLVDGYDYPARLRERAPLDLAEDRLKFVAHLYHSSAVYTAISDLVA